MELRQLRCLVAVVEEGGFTRAAARLHLAQPGLSAQSRQLEKELGQPLLDRSGRSVTPTEVAGPSCRTRGRRWPPRTRCGRPWTSTGLLRGRVTLGLLSGAPGHAFDVEGVAAFLAEFHGAHPALEIALTEDTSERMQTALLAGEIDIALLGPTWEEPPPGLTHRTVIDVPLCAAVASGDPLLVPAGRTTVPLAELRDRPLICLPRGTGVRASLERGCARAGFRPRVAFEAASPQVLAQFAARGLASP
ncbi:LysR substrate-binding domain-containing protein [Streptomyces virginiae]|uniref:LysR substrate-binding domain-containing protein n=1 Tax=Streptomyces virginiae TaxID=1961 RepID=UPI0037D2EB5E